jgi:Cft2 family RNA processing exonuclease
MRQALRLLTRTGCDLCDTMHEELARLAHEQALPPLTLVDVDADPDLRRRYGLKVPVLLLDDDLVCFGRLDRGELLRLVRPRA